MTSDKKKSPMYFASLEVTNVKSFGTKQTLNLRDSNGVLSPWTLILGDNGIGKTTLLKCLAWMMPVQFAEPVRFQVAKKLKTKDLDEKLIKEVTSVTEKEWKLISEDILNTEEVERITPLLDSVNENVINSIIRVGKGVKMNIGAKFTNNVALKTVPDQQNLIEVGISFSRKVDESRNEIDDIDNTDHLITARVDKFNSPNLFAYSAARHMATENFDFDELKNPTYNLFSNTGDLYDAEEVLLKLYNDSLEEEKEALEKKQTQLEAQLKETTEKLETRTLNTPTSLNENKESDDDLEGRATKYLRKVKEILAKLLPDIETADSIIINPSNKKEGKPNTKVVEVVTSFGKVGLYDLSLGYQTMLAWVVDLAIRMFWQDPDSDDPLDEPAVVIVDEIDLHLHPKWQRTLKDYLTGNFKKTQFICTAHSPFIAQASEDENLCVLHEVKLTPRTNEVAIENDPTIVKGWRIGQIVTNLFGVPETSLEIEKLRLKRREIIDKPEQTPEDRKTLEEINERLLKIPVSENAETQKLLDQIRITAELLKKEGKLK